MEMSVRIREKEYEGVANVGYNPTFNRDRLCVETHLLDFMKDIYNEPLEIRFVDRIRDEIKFSERSMLVDQMKKDVEQARVILKKNVKR